MIRPPAMANVKPVRIPCLSDSSAMLAAYRSEAPPERFGFAQAWQYLATVLQGCKR